MDVGPRATTRTSKSIRSRFTMASSQDHAETWAKFSRQIVRYVRTTNPLLFVNIAETTFHNNRISPRICTLLAFVWSFHIEQGLRSGFDSQSMSLTTKESFTDRNFSRFSPMSIFPKAFVTSRMTSHFINPLAFWSENSIGRGTS